MFLGEYKLKFTGLRRIILPRKFRGELGSMNEVVLSRGLDNCIFGFAKSAWEKETKRQLEIPITSEEGRNLRRYLFSAAEDVKLDRQGRFVIPKVLLDYANLKEEVVLVGAGDHFEIWNPKTWSQLIKEITHEGKETK